MAKECQTQAVRVGSAPEVAAMGREAVKQGRMTPKEAQELYDKARINDAIAEILGYDVFAGSSEELPEQLNQFTGAINPDGSVKFS